jgi:tight adherence protein B
MNALLQSREAMIIGVALCSLMLLIMSYVLIAPRPPRVARGRLRPNHLSSAEESTLSVAATRITALIERVLRRRNMEAHVAVLERAGVNMRLQDVVLLVIAASLAAGALGAVLVGPVIGMLFALVTPVLARVFFNLKASRRQSTFADQLDDSLQLIAASLRAGHSLLQALASVAREAEEPTREEFARVINETRVGRPLAQSLEETAARMASQDFVWVTQAIAINREVGGNLADVLDGVGHTIRERNQIRRQVRALSAEGKLSAYVLMALPVGITAFLGFTNPTYISAFVESFIGYVLIGVCVVQFTIGGLWMRKVVSLEV